MVVAAEVNLQGHAAAEDTTIPLERKSVLAQRRDLWRFHRIQCPLDIPPHRSIIRTQFLGESLGGIDSMRIVMTNVDATQLRGSGGALLPWSQCACR
jgi:hypothetical protein